jgi:ribosomal protein S12 methylthiotransferase
MFILTQENPSLKMQYHIDPRAPEVSLVFLNTCGFISSGRDEMMHTIKRLKKAGKHVTVMGCGLRYVQLTGQTLEGVDLIERQDLDRFTLQSPRAFTNAHLGFEYLKIAEGCDNHCSFCIIPKLR